MMQDYDNELAVIKKLLKNNPNGMCVTDISRALKKNKNTIGRYLDILLISGQVEMRTYGMAKVFTLSRRVPLSAMLSYSKELIMVLDADSRIIDANENFLQILGLERAGAIGKNIDYLCSPEIDVHELIDTGTGGEPPERTGTVTLRIKEKGERIYHVKRIPTVFDDGGKGLTVILEDMTEHILAEREIQESEERFRMMAENIQDGLIILENKKSVYVNNRLAGITGYTSEELGRMDPLSCIAPESRKSVRQQIRDIETLRTGPSEIQAWIIRKDGNRRFVSIRTTVLQHEEKDYSFVIITDITELKEKEAALSRSEERFRMMAENIRDGLIIIENNDIVFANRRMTEITGFTPEEMTQLNFLDILSGEQSPAPELADAVFPDGPYRLEEIIRGIKSGAETPGEATFWINRKNGTRRCVQGAFSATENNGIISIYITATDITAFAEKEEARRDRVPLIRRGRVS